MFKIILKIFTYSRLYLVVKGIPTHCDFKYVQILDIDLKKRNLKKSTCIRMQIACIVYKQYTNSLHKPNAFAASLFCTIKFTIRHSTVPTTKSVNGTHSKTTTNSLLSHFRFISSTKLYQVLAVLIPSWCCFKSNSGIVYVLRFEKSTVKMPKTSGEQNCTSPHILAAVLTHLIQADHLLKVKVGSCISLNL